MKQTPPLSACCNEGVAILKANGKTISISCLKCQMECDIATPSGTIKAQQVSGTSVNVSSSKNIPTQNIATPDTEECKKQLRDIIGYKYSHNEYCNVDECGKSKPKCGSMSLLDEDIEEISQLIRTEKLKVVEQVKLEEEKIKEDFNKTFNNRDFFAYYIFDDYKRSMLLDFIKRHLNAIREKLRNNI